MMTDFKRKTQSAKRKTKGRYRSDCIRVRLLLKYNFAPPKNKHKHKDYLLFIC